MKISNLNCQEILIESQVIEDFISENITTSKLFIYVSVNCCDEEKYKELTFPINEESYYITDSKLYITPGFLGLTEFTGGIYKIGVKLLYADNSYKEDINCNFIDCNIKCKVASFIENLISDDNELLQEAVYVSMLHYSLVNGGNCGCNCTEMCEVYKNLINIININTNNNCGC